MEGSKTEREQNESTNLQRLLFPPGRSLRPHARRALPHVQSAKPRRARPATPAAPRAAARRGRRRPVGCLDYAAVQEEREPTARPPEEERALEERPEKFGR